MAIDFYNAGMNAYQAGNYKEAYEWLIQCKDEGHCAYALGVLFYNGQGVERNFKSSTHYYAKGEAGGDRKEAARLLREVLAVNMPEEATDIYNRYELYKV